jgi:hypothetical protein
LLGSAKAGVAIFAERGILRTKRERDIERKLAFIPFLVLAVFSISVPYSTAHDPTNLGVGPEDKLRLLSPDGQEELRNIGDIFVINPPGVDGTFFSDDISELESALEHSARYATWSPNSHMIAVCVKTSKEVEDTFVLIHQGEYGWRYLALPYDDPEAWVIPLRWLDSNTLVIGISGPRYGKSEPDPDFYDYTLTVKYVQKSDHFVKVSASKKEYPERHEINQ